MIAIKRLIAACAVLCVVALGIPAPLAAQVSSAIVVASCGTPPSTYTAGANRQITQDTTGKLCGANTGTISGTVTTTPLGATSTDASGTVTLGGTYQTVFASNASRKGCLIQNPTTATEILSVKVGTMASPLTIPAGSTFSCSSGSGVVVTDAITLTAATTTHAFVAVSQ